MSDFEKLYNEIHSLKLIINDINLYLIKKYDEEISFHLNCNNIGLDHIETSKLFLLYANETEDKKIIDKNKLINDTKEMIPKLKDTENNIIIKLIDSFINGYL